MEIRNLSTADAAESRKAAPTKEKSDQPSAGVVTDWFRENVSGDGREGLDYGALVTAGLGVAGAGAGGYLANRDVKRDTVFIKYANEKVPKAEHGEIADFGRSLSRTDLRVLGEFVKASATGDDAAKDIRYLAYMASRHPGESPISWGAIYEGVKLHAQSPAQAREVMQILAACIEKYPDTPPQQVYMEYLTRVNRTDSPAKALESLAKDFGIQESDYMETLLKFKPVHTSKLWKLGAVGATAAGIVAGALVGVGLGALATAIMRVVLSPEEAPGQKA